MVDDPGGDVEEREAESFPAAPFERQRQTEVTVSYTHLRAHETVLDLVCRLLLEKKNNNHSDARLLYKNVKR